MQILEDAWLKATTYIWDEQQDIFVLFYTTFINWMISRMWDHCVHYSRHESSVWAGVTWLTIL